MITRHHRERRPASGRTTQRAIAAFVALALAAGAGACGDDDDDDAATDSEPAAAVSAPAATSEATDAAATSAPSDATTATTGSSAAPATEPAEMLPVNIISTSPTFTSLPHSVMMALDLYAANGIDANVDLGADNAALIAQAVIAGDADIGIAGTGAVFNAYSEGMTDLVVIATMSCSLTFGVALNSETVEALAEQGITPDSPVEERVQALRGLSIGASPAGSTGDSYPRLMLTTYGVDPAEVTLVPNNDGNAQVAAARAGRINGYALSFPNALIPEVEGWGALWLNFAEDLPGLIPFAAHSIYTTRQYLEGSRETTVGIVAALWDALGVIKDSPDEAKEPVKSDSFPDLDQAVYDEGWDLSVEAYAECTPITTEEMFQRQLDLVNSTRETPMELAMSDIYDLTVPEDAQP
jgi:NitT/TauT family transport system substrate-binding protein